MNLRNRSGYSALSGATENNHYAELGIRVIRSGLRFIAAIPQPLKRGPQVYLPFHANRKRRFEAANIWNLEIRFDNSFGLESLEHRCAVLASHARFDTQSDHIGFDQRIGSPSFSGTNRKSNPNSNGCPCTPRNRSVNVSA